VRGRTGLGVVTEVMDPRLVEQVASFADMLQIGSRSMQNFPLLKEVGQTSTPVLLKRGWSVTLKEWLCAAEYVAAGGNRNIILCERGVRESCRWDRSVNVLDLDVIGPLREACPLPIIVDPSHVTDDWTRVEPMSRAAVAAGVDGLLIEVVRQEADRPHIRCDGHRGIPPATLARIVAEARRGAA